MDLRNVEIPFVVIRATPLCPDSAVLKRAVSTKTACACSHHSQESGNMGFIAEGVRADGAEVDLSSTDNGRLGVTQFPHTAYPDEYPRQ